MRFKIDWASLLVGRKFTVFALFFFVFEGNFHVQAPPRGGGGLYLGEGVRFNRGFFTLRVWGAYTWRGLFSEFYGISTWLVRARKEFWVIESHRERRSVGPPSPTSEILYL